MKEKVKEAEREANTGKAKGKVKSEFDANMPSKSSGCYEHSHVSCIK